MKRGIPTVLFLLGLLSFLGSWRITTARTTEDARIAGMLAPWSLEIRLSQIESLLLLYREHKKDAYLDEAEKLATEVKKWFPGNTQAWAALASIQVWARAHGLDIADGPVYDAVWEAMDRDPLSVEAIEIGMFLLTIDQKDLETFKRLGIKRASLTGEALSMKCPLCGRHWLLHGRR
jgi:hypothetical protein